VPLPLLLLSWLAAAAVAAILVYAGIALAMDFLTRRAVAHLTDRSSHAAPTPQGAGIVIVPVTIAVAAVTLALAGLHVPGGTSHAAIVAGAAILLMLVGFIDDVHPLGVTLRLAAQVLAVGLAVLLAPPDLRVFASVPIEAERVALILVGLWFINLFNFMDGIDLISATETSAIALGIIMLAAIGVVSGSYGLVAAALLGATLGFVPWNAPPARVFLGDAGSLPIGFLLGVLLFHVAASGAFAAAAILPLYHVADSTVTLVRRLIKGEKIWQPHRQHFYQMACRKGFAVIEVVRHVAILDAGLIVLAVASAWFGPVGAGIAIVLAKVFVIVVLVIFARGRPQVGTA
jgi:UDP-N-acetylmuramyl pentapeptide phosphotransferase/UDP-N-acetylglucosamine-1-phosphate transferase